MIHPYLVPHIPRQPARPSPPPPTTTTRWSSSGGPCPAAAAARRRRWWTRTATWRGSWRCAARGPRRAGRPDPPLVVRVTGWIVRVLIPSLVRLLRALVWLVRVDSGVLAQPVHTGFRGRVARGRCGPRSESSRRQASESSWRPSPATSWRAVSESSRRQAAVRVAVATRGAPRRLG